MKKKPRDGPDRRQHVPAGVLLLPLGCLYLLVIVSAFLPGHRLWGVNHLAFYSVPVRIAALGLIGLSFIPPMRRAVSAAFMRALRYVHSRPKSAVWVALSGSVLSIVVFMVFQSSTLLLGDGQLIADKLGPLLAEDRGVVSTIESIVSTERIAPGTTILYYLVGLLVLRVHGADAVLSIKLCTALLGSILVGLLLFLVARLSGRPEMLLCVALLSLTSGVMQLYFGYVENYAALVFFGSLYVISGIRYVHGRGRLWVPLTLLACGAFSHVEGVLLAPSAALLVAWRFMDRSREAPLRVVTYLLFMFTLAAAVAGRAFTGLAGFYLPVVANNHSYGVLTPSHWVDIFNQLLILQPTWFLFLVIAGAVVRLMRLHKQGRPTPAGGAGTGEPGWLTTRMEWNFVVLLLASCGTYLVLFRPEIGMSRDWDLFSIMVLAIIPLSLLILNRFIHLIPSRAFMVTIAAPSIFLSAVLMISWVGVNHDPTKTALRLERTLEYDQSHAPYIYENLARHYQSENRMADAVRVAESASAMSDNPRHQFNLSLLYLDSGRTEDAFRLLRRILEVDPRYPRVRDILIMALYRDRRFDEIVDVARDGTRLAPDSPFYHYYLGKCLIVLGRKEEGAAALRHSRRLEPPPGMLKDIEKLLTP